MKAVRAPPRAHRGIPPTVAFTGANNQLESRNRRRLFSFWKATGLTLTRPLAFPLHQGLVRLLHLSFSQALVPSCFLALAHATIFGLRGGSLYSSLVSASDVSNTKGSPLTRRRCLLWGHPKLVTFPIVVRFIGFSWCMTICKRQFVGCVISQVRPRTFQLCPRRALT